MSCATIPSTVAAAIAATLLGVCLASCGTPPPSPLGPQGRSDAGTPSEPSPHIRLWAALRPLGSRACRSERPASGGGPGAGKRPRGSLLRPSPGPTPASARLRGPSLPHPAGVSSRRHVTKGARAERRSRPARRSSDAADRTRVAHGKNPRTSAARATRCTASMYAAVRMSTLLR